MRTIMALVALALVGSACGSGAKTNSSGTSPTPSPSTSESSIPPNTVLVVNNNFSPGTLTVSAGTTVTWSDISSNPHNVVSVDKLFNSNPKCQGDPADCLSKGETFTYTFSAAGTFKYYCFIHGQCSGGACSGMAGTIAVT